MLKEFKNKWIWKDKEPGPHRYIKWDDMMNDLKKRKAVLQELIMGIWYTIKQMIEWPGDFMRDLKWSCQRSIRGWSDSDAWNMHHSISRTIIGIVKWLRENKTGYPCSHNIKSHGVEEKQIEAWNKILDDIIWTFEVCVKISDSEWYYPQNWRKYTKAEEKFRIKSKEFNKEHSIHWMTDKEIERYNNGWKFFKQFFFNLWD